MELAARQAELTSLRAQLEAERAAFVAPVAPAPEPSKKRPSASRPASVTDDIVVVHDSDSDRGEEVEVFEDAEEAAQEEEGPKRKARRSSVDASQLAQPVLQSRLKAILGPRAKLPRKKAELLALYIKHRDD